MAEDADIGFEEGMSWLPSHVLDEACGDYVKDRSGERGGHYQHHHQHHRIRLIGEPLPPHAKSSMKGHHKARYPNNRASGGPGMQAIFLDSGHRSCGTGVFLPRTAGANFNQCTCAPVLLPSRVIQALNLNVHALGLQVTSPRDPKGNKRSGGSNFVGNKEGKDVASHCSVISPDSSPSRDTFLPKEWSY